MNDLFGQRMKEQYEDRTRYSLPRRTYTILRLDGKAFHTYTRGLLKPFDNGLMNDLDEATLALFPNIQGVVFAYNQSDEISILVTDFENIDSCAWFDGNIQKITSVAASIMTAEFNKRRIYRQFNEKNQWYDQTQAYFDCRVFTIPDRIEVMNYFRWRQQDCVRNSISMLAQYYFLPNQLHKKSQSDMHEMLHEIGINWARDLSDGQKNGRIVYREFSGAEDERGQLVAKGAWDFKKNEQLLTMIPEYE